MNHVMLDIDGTLIQSYELDEQCFVSAVQEVTGLTLSSDWEAYPHATDKGILQTFVERQAPHYSFETLERLVKPVFIRNIANTLRDEPAKEIPGSEPKESSKADTDAAREGKSDTKDTVEESDPKASDETGGGEQEKSENSKDDGKTKEEKEEASKKLQELLEIQRKAFLEAKKPDQVM